MESFEYPGFWWVSGASQHKVAGIISFSQDNGISLELIGKLEFVSNRDIILGTTHKGIFSLLDCTPPVNTSSLQGLNTQCYRARIAFLDHHFSNLDEVKFSKLQALDQRLQALLQITRETMIPIIAKPEEFFRSVRYTRNYRTHYDDSLKNKSLSGDDIARTTEILDFMVKACLLSELNCTSDRCEQLISRSRRYQYLKESASTARI